MNTPAVGEGDHDAMNRPEAGVIDIT